MNFGIVADEIDRDFEKAVRIGKQLGLYRYEIRHLLSGRAPMCDGAELIAVERIAEREEVEITALSPGLFKSTADEAAFRREMEQMYPRAAEWAHRWKLPGVIVFGFHRAGNVADAGAWLAEAANQACRDGLTLMIEPEPICRAGTGRETVALIQECGAGSLKINYDPGNVAWLTNRDPLEEFEAVAPWIANVHVKDLKPLSGEPEWVPSGEGIIAYRAHFAALRRTGCQGPVSLEPHVGGNLETIRRCKSACERLWEGDAE